MKFFYFVFSVCLLTLNASCPQQVANPIDCTNDENICTDQGLICDRRIHQCVAVSGCVTAAMCSSPSASSCVDNQCIPCAQDAECASWSDIRNATPRRTFCAPINQQTICAECRPDMSATDCTDPLNPICDRQLGLCRPCRADKDCASRICRKAGDYPEISPVPGLLVGQCVPIDQISYVDRTNASCIDSGIVSSQELPLCRISSAFGAEKPYISVAPSREIYGGVTLDQPGKTRILVGPAADTRAFAYLDRVNVKNGTLIAQNIVFYPITTGMTPLTCTGSASSLYLLGANFTNINRNNVNMIDASTCGHLTVDRSLINCLDSTGSKHGILVGASTGTATTTFKIVNSVIISCGSTTEAGVQLNSLATGYFGFNNILACNNGVRCASPSQTIVNSIIVENTTTQISGCAFDPQYNITDGMQIDSSSPPFLDANSAKNAMRVIDKALPPPDDLKLSFDYDGNLRPQGTGYDIGMQELK